MRYVHGAQSPGQADLVDVLRDSASFASEVALNTRHNNVPVHVPHESRMKPLKILVDHFNQFVARRYWLGVISLSYYLTGSSI